MLWWNNTKETEEIEKELPEDLKEFFKDNNPDSKQANKYEISPHEKLVNKKLSSIKEPYSYEFEVYKKKNDLRNVSMINCSELQLKVIDCFKKMDFSNLDGCQKQVKQNKKCMEIQKDAFKKLYYEDCYNITHCDKIRFLVDHLFTKNFGQYGEKMDDENLIKFNNDLDKSFTKIWK
ncbi:hypothetical protein CLIB1444_16S00980 [[Candida] jaroonii]|uniref:Uncharacterized protein n=1 Tax=[Candida] jaroonii TaxID=467808 RepID=A0ACA9YES6_9ASCO|nr:hypothetical protein CLIB1444_16S00980 [[Candida] jaroonii]